jgi:tripartite ATP-independent transporter DctM subunit
MLQSRPGAEEKETEPMAWYVTLTAILLILLTLIILFRVPVVFGLLGTSLIVLFWVYGFDAASRIVPLGIASSMSAQALAPIVLFFLMGEIMFRSGTVSAAVEAIRTALDRTPGKLAISSTVSGAVLGAVSGSPMATTALLGKNLVPEMIRLKYSPRLASGSVLSAGGLAMVIPPSTVTVVLGATAGIPVGPLLVAGIIPGVLLATGYLIVQTVWVRGFGGDGEERNLSSAGERSPLWERVKGLPGALLPLVLIFALVLGLIIFGLATPTESAAFGVLAAVGVAATKRQLTRTMLWESARSTAILVGAVLLLVGCAGVFSQALAASGVLPGFLSAFGAFELSGTVMVILLLAVVVFLGLFLETIAIIMICAPFFMPIITQLGVDPLWFGILWLVAMQIGLTTPPFGMNLFVLRKVVPDFSMGVIYRSALPFLSSDVTVVALLIVFPALITGFAAE